MKFTTGLCLVSLLAMPARAESPKFDGWVVGEPCAQVLRVADCPLRFVDRPVLLLENGATLAFVFGEGKAIAPAEIDKVYARKVSMTGEIRDGVLAPVKLDLLETVGERKFFKGCL